MSLIEFFGGRCHFVADPAHVYVEAERLAQECNGHNMDQFTFAERATAWRGNNNIAESIFEQMRGEPHPTPKERKFNPPRPTKPSIPGVVMPVKRRASAEDRLSARC